MSDLGRWIADYITAFLGKECVTQPDWDPQTSRLVQIVERKQLQHERHEPESTGLNIVISDGHVLINCKICPQMLTKYNPKCFQNNVLIHLSAIDLRITCDFKSIYFLSTDCAFSNAIPVVSVCKHQAIQSVNNMKCVQRLLCKYRTCVSFRFQPDANAPNKGFDPHNLPYSSHSTDELWGFEVELNALDIKGHEPCRNLELEAMDLNELCKEQNVNTKNTSNKEEMEDNDDEVVPTHEVIGNSCDWLSDLYPDFGDVPLVLKRDQQPMIKPVVLNAPEPKKSNKRKASPLEKDHTPPPFKKARIMTEYKEDVEGPDEDTSTDVLQCDMVMEKKQKEKEVDHVFAKPMYSLTERYKTKARVENTEGDGVNDSIVSSVSIQESVTNDMERIELNECQSNNVVEEDSDDGIMELDEYDRLNASDGDETESNVVHTVDRVDVNNEPINREYLGLISANDLSHIRRYFVNLGEELNGEGNGNPDNPFRNFTA